MKTDALKLKLRWTLLCLLFMTAAHAQFNNEWIDFSKTYYKFRIGSSGIFRIPAATLQAAGLAATPAEHFQLWRNGEEVPLYTSTPTGLLGTSGFIEFLGKMNDGSVDGKLYPDPALQLSDKWSLHTDTTAYFLTVNAAGGNLRMIDMPNDPAAGNLTPEPFFLHTLDLAYRTRLNQGYGVYVGLFLYSSSYEVGEGWSSREITPATPLEESLQELYQAAGGQEIPFTISASGNASNTRTLQVSVNGSQVMSQTLDNLGGGGFSGKIPAGLLGRPADKIVFSNGSAITTDRMVVHRFRMTYPRLFNFGGATRFEFSLPASTTGNLLEISNFNYGTTAPVLLDLTNRRRYTADLSSSGKLRFALPPSGSRDLVLCSIGSGQVGNIAQLQTRKFTDFRSAQNQGSFLIISSSRLFAGPNGNPVENYRAYRASAAGGGHDARIFDIDQLVDQFAFGIKMHPLSVKNFLRFSRQYFARKPEYVFLMGRGLTYDQLRLNESRPSTDNIALIPTFGNPGSDNMLSADDLKPDIQTPVGRLSVVYPQEIEDYLVKVREHELALKTGGQTLKDRAWMKNVVHAVGGSDPYLQGLLFGYMNVARDIVADTLFGANVKSFSNNPAYATQQLTTAQLQSLFTEGINILTYFGHSSASALEFNISDPYAYDNQGKYPMFVVNGCNAGNFFLYDTTRFTTSNLTLSEKYVMAKQRGSIGFIASTHYGIVNYLNLYITNLYKTISGPDYGRPIGQVQKTALAALLQSAGTGDLFARMHAEQITLHGDPAIRLYAHAKPDYVLEDAQVRINPSFVSVADAGFEIEVKVHNIGKAIRDSIILLVNRQLPGGAITEILRKKIPAVAYVDSLKIHVPINPLTDKGDNRILLKIDAEDRIPELSEDNNSITKTVTIIEDEVRPSWPTEFSIVNTEPVAFFASTANPLVAAKQYLMELDTTALFNSPLRKSASISSAGGALQFSVPGLTLMDSTVYYWRTAPAPASGGNITWNTSSFLFLRGPQAGYAQSHYFQHLKSAYTDIHLDEDRRYRFGKKPSNLVIKTGIFPIYPKSRLNVQVDEKYYVLWGCRPASLQFVIYDSISVLPLKNSVQSGGLGMYGSIAPCQYNDYLFEFPYDDFNFRKAAMDLLDSLPKGYYVSVTNVGLLSNTVFVKDWMNDTLRLGSGRSLYHSMMRLGLVDIERFSSNVPFLFFFRKGIPGFPIYSFMGTRQDEFIEKRFDLEMGLAKGQVLSPWFGPSQKWTAFKWAGSGIEQSPDNVVMDIIARDNNGIESTLANIHPGRDTSLAFIDAKRYPYLRVRMNNKDSIHFTPEQLRYWRLMADLPPEGAVAPNLRFSGRDTLESGEPFDLQLAFRNISRTAFDSIRVLLTVTDQNNVRQVIPMSRKRPLPEGDTLVVSYRLDTKNFNGDNILYVNLNPDNDQPEQYLFNNFLYRNFHVRQDKLNPTLDVTFNGVRILNRDIVSAKPHILIRLKDNNRYLALDDTSLLNVRIRHPDGTTRAYRFDNDTMRFTPADLSQSGENTASIDLRPAFSRDGEYELLVNGKDRSGNVAGQPDYRVLFNIVNKPMISNLLNYPNPFTTSTAFVFTVTGSDLPQNMRIQILTVTGKIVREITREELGPIRIGRNVTEYKWDGTDQFGQKLANGVYLYRFISTLNGKPMEKLRLEGDDTDRFFTEGYGKMYLMR
jgi:hypothetical protein